jgi:hypothetical protein
MIIHLLIPKEFKVWCLPRRSAGDLNVTTRSHKATCANCLSLWRSKTTGKRARVRSSTLRDIHL